MVAESRAWAEQVQEILEHLRMAERGCLLLVAVDDEKVQEGIVSALKEHLDGQMELSEHALDPTYPSLGAYLRTLPPPTGRAAVLVYGLDDLSEEAKERAFRYLNLEREVMRLAGRSVVLFIKSDTVPELMQRSPDFYAWSSGLFEFQMNWRRRGSWRPSASCWPEATWRGCAAATWSIWSMNTSGWISAASSSCAPSCG